MTIVTTKDFERALDRLPAEAQSLYQNQEKRFHLDWRDPRLHVKKLRGLPGTFSFRVTRRYRVLFYFIRPEEEVVFFDIGHRKDVY